MNGSPHDSSHRDHPGPPDPEPQEWPVQEPRVPPARRADAEEMSPGRPGRQADAELFPRTEEQLRFRASLLDSVGQAVIATDVDGRVILWNRAAEHFYGWTREEALGRAIEGLNVRPEHVEVAREIMETVLEGSTWTGEFEVVRRDGSRFPALVTNTPIRGADGGVVGIVGVSTDLTERKELEERLRESQRMEAVGRLSGGIAHGFNNVLTAVEGYADLLRERLQDDPHAREDLRALVGAARRARQLTSQLLAFSRRQILHPRTLSLSHHLVERRSMVEALTAEGVEVELGLTDAPDAVHVDPAQLDQVLVHLTLNAVEAMPDGGTIRLEVKESGGGYRTLVVLDEGEGIPEDVRGRVFEPFFTTRPEKGASGLGLSTVHGIVAQSGGHVELDSREGRGTEVRVHLPAEGSAPSETAGA